jgi:type I restriction-modification system DNA methylase subunit
MASEELNTRYPDGKGKKIGSYELFETQLVTIKQFAEHGILPNIDYGSLKTQKCDMLIISRVPDVHAMLIGEYKKPGTISDTNWKAFADDLLKTKCHPLSSEVGIVTDKAKTFWINGKANEVIEITREDNEPLPQIVDFSDQSFLSELKYILSYFDPITNQVKAKQKTNPDHLAREVWQTVWRLKADNPEDCLATFVELFVFKFLDDLRLLKTDDVGKPVSLEYLMQLDKHKSYSYYFDVVRPYIKQLFPNGKDGYSIINGIVLQKENRDHNFIFHEIMKKFIQFGTLKNTDTDFKRRLYESFLKQSKTTSTFGQFFTPRVIVSAIHDMADVENLAAGKIICDPAAGVGGFVLEQMARDLASQWQLKGATMKSIHEWHSLEKIPKTSILAKANALVHCGDLLSDQPNRIKSFSKWLNSTFYCYDQTALGSLETLEKNRYDLILTNPPFVVSGSRDYGKIISKDNKRKKYFNQKCSGVEGLFVQFIVNALKANGEAWVLLPESFFLRTPDRELRNWLLKNCQIRFIALLPERVFYNTPKKVVILNLKKRTREETSATILSKLRNEKTGIFAVSEIGETRDSKRFPCSSDLMEMVKIFRSHKAGLDINGISERALSIQSSEIFNNQTINLRQFWNKEIAVKLGILGSVEGAEEAKKRLNYQLEEIEDFINENKADFLKLEVPKKTQLWKKVKLSDKELFRLRIGKRVLKKDIYTLKTETIVFSANIRKPFGYVVAANAGNLINGGCLWSIDSDFDCRGVPIGEIYSITDHCGQIEICDNKIDPHYLARQIQQVGINLGFNREFRPSLKVIAEIEIELPITTTGDFDLDLMLEDSEFHEKIEKINSNIISLLESDKEEKEDNL